MPLIRRRVVALPLLALVAAVGALTPAAHPVLAADCGTGATSLENGGFEVPGVAPDTFELLPEASVPPWRTTDVGGAIELWGDTFLGVPAYEGTTFAELNANSAGTLYQDIITTPGATMTWTLHHRGREGEDTMRVLIGDAATADVSGDAGWDATSGDLVDGASAWGEHSDSYVVPAGQTCTRFGFRAVSSSNGDASYGNLLDGITFVITIPATPTPKPTPKATSKPAPNARGTSRPKMSMPPTDTIRASSRGADLDAALLVSGGLVALASAAVITTRSRRRARP